MLSQKGELFQVGEFITIDPDEWIWYMQKPPLREPSKTAVQKLNQLNLFYGLGGYFQKHLEVQKILESLDI